MNNLVEAEGMVDIGEEEEVEAEVKGGH